MSKYLMDYDRILQSQLRALEESKVCLHNKETILKFYRCNVTNGISKARLIRQLQTLRTIALFLGKDFELVTREDYERCRLLKQKQRLMKQTNC